MPLSDNSTTSPLLSLFVAAYSQHTRCVITRLASMPTCVFSSLPHAHTYARRVNANMALVAQTPTSKRGPDDKPVLEPYSAEATYYTESRLLQREVKVRGGRMRCDLSFSNKAANSAYQSLVRARV